jgi:polygalacturonase
MAERFPKPCERVEIAHCLMENGHGGVTVGSEMSGGVRDVTVHHCLMRDTDRGLRIKTRRGRGGAVDGVTLRSVRMERVGAPLT